MDTNIKLNFVPDTTKVNTAIGRLKGSLQGLQGMMAGVFAAWITTQGIRKISDAASEVIGLKGAMAALEVQTRKANVSSEALINTLERATRGQVATRDMVLSTNTAIALLGTEAIPRLGELAEVASKASTALGTDLTQAFADIVKGIGRQSRLILDNLGIIIDAEKAYGDYATMIGKVASELTEAERKQAFLNETIAQGMEKFGDIEAVVDPVKQAQAVLVNLGNTLATIFVEAGGLGLFENVVGGLERMSSALDDVGESAEALITLRATFEALVGTGAILGLTAIVAQINGVAAAAILANTALRANTAALATYSAWLTTTSTAAQAGPGGGLNRIFQNRVDTLRAERVALLANVPAWGAYIARLVAVVGIGAVLFLAYQNNERAQRALNLTVEDAEEAYKEVQSEMTGANTLLRDMTTVLGTVTDSSELTQGQVDFLKESIKELSSEFPGLIEQTGFAIDADGMLYDASQVAVTGIDDLQTAVDAFNTQNIINQTATAIEALLLLTQSRLTAAVGPEGSLEPGIEQRILEEERGKPGFLPPDFRAGVRLFMLDIGTGLNALREATLGTTTQAIESAERENIRDMEALLERVRNLGVTTGGGTIPLGPGPGAAGGGTPELTIAERKLEGAMIALMERINEGKTTMLEEIAAREAVAEALKLEEIARAEMKIDAVAAYQIALLRDKPLTKPKLTDAERAKRAAEGEDLPEELETVFEVFVRDLANTLENAIAAWGWQGQKPDMMGMGQNLLAGPSAAWGGNLLSYAGASEGAAAMWGGPVGAVISAGVGAGLNAIFNQPKPLEIKQPLNVHIDDDQFRLLTFYNFRGLNPYAHHSSFRQAFMGGLN